MEILFEDKNVIFAIKPVGVASQKTDNGKDMVTILSEHTKSEVFPVHRLDTATGGIMVYAKNNKTAAKLSAAFAENKTDKEYLAVACGCLPDFGEMTDYLWHDKIKNKSFSVKTERKGAKKAVLSYEKLADGDGFSFVKVHLETGRTHQIRAQFATRGFPLCGDGKYGGKSGYQMALWCYKLTLPYPSDNETTTYTSLPPIDNEPWSLFSFENL